MARIEKHKIGDRVKWVGQDTELREDGLRYYIPSTNYGKKGTVVETYQNDKFCKVLGYLTMNPKPGYKVKLDDVEEPILGSENNFHKIK